MIFLTPTDHYLKNRMNWRQDFPLPTHIAPGTGREHFLPSHPQQKRVGKTWQKAGLSEGTEISLCCVTPLPRWGSSFLSTLT